MKCLLLILLLSGFCSAQVQRPSQRVIDRKFAIWQGVEAAALTFDGYTTVDGWSHGCYEGNSPSNSKRKVIVQLAVEKGVEFGFDWYIKRGSRDSDVKWVWRLGGGIITILHTGAAVNNIRIGCG